MNYTIFKPHFTMTAEISSLLSVIDRQRRLVEDILVMPKHQAWISRDVRIRRADRTLLIGSIGMRKDTVRSRKKSWRDGKDTVNVLAGANAFEAYEFVDFLSDQTDIPIDELVIRQLNRYFMNGVDKMLVPGGYRKEEHKVAKFVPPSQSDVPRLMRAFARWLREEDGIHPILKAGIAHIHLLAVHPFWGGNERTARGLLTLILQRSPFHFKRLLVLDSHPFDNRDEYFAAIEHTLGRKFAPEYDATSWLELFTMAVSDSARYLAALLAEWHRVIQEFHNDTASAVLNHRQVDGFLFALQSGQLTRTDYVDITDASTATASRDLANLVERGILIAEGNTRSRIYFPTRLVSDGVNVLTEK